MLATAHVHTDAKPRRDPCGCQDLRSRLGTYLRKAVANWQRDIRMALIGADDTLSIAHVLLGTSSKPQDRLERYTAFARSAMQRRLQTVDFGVLVQAYKRGTASGFAEAGMLPHNAPANGGFYIKQAENDLHGIGEEVIKRISRTVALGLATGVSGSRLYRNVLPAFREVALPRVKLLATTLITTAYNGGKLDTFELLGKTHVGIVSETVPKTLTKDANFYKKGSRNVIVEYLTAGDDLVCPICEDLEGTYYTLAGARGLLPRHPNCRCSVELASDFNDSGFDPDEPRDEHGRWTGLPQPENVIRQMVSYRTSYGLDVNGLYDPERFDKREDELKDDDGKVIAVKDILVPKSGSFEKFDRLDAPKASGVIYRGMSFKEYQLTRERGTIKSEGTYNIGSGQEGLTYYSTNPSEAVSYAASFAPQAYKPSPDNPAFVVAVRAPSSDRVRNVAGTGSSEVGVVGELPISNVLAVYQGDVVAYTPPIERKGFRASATTTLLWRKL